MNCTQSPPHLDHRAQQGNRVVSTNNSSLRRPRDPLQGSLERILNPSDPCHSCKVSRTELTNSFPSHFIIINQAGQKSSNAVIERRCHSKLLWLHLLTGFRMSAKDLRPLLVLTCQQSLRLRLLVSVDPSPPSLAMVPLLAHLLVFTDSDSAP